MSAPIHVLNYKGRDAFIDYTNGYDLEKDSHPPVNFHAYCSATKGAFHRSIETIPQEKSIILVLIRKKIKIYLKIIKKLKDLGHKVIISWKECGIYQITNQVNLNKKNWSYFLSCLQNADFLLCPTKELYNYYNNIFAPEKIIYLPTPYPISKFTFREVKNRYGILIGTREFKIASRRHMEAVQIALKISQKNICRVHLISPHIDLRNIPNLEIYPSKLPYNEYLTLIKKVRLVFQLDNSFVPGQIAGDCLLAQNICVGGNGEIERIAFRKFDDLNDQIDYTKKLLKEDDFYLSEIESSQAIAQEKISFSAFRNNFFKLLD